MKFISLNVGGWEFDEHICYSEQELKGAYKDIKAGWLLMQKYMEKKNELCFEGGVSIEFLLDENDELYFSEINFRVSTWGWASTMAGMNLPYLWGETMTSGKAPGDIYKSIPDNFTAMVEPIDYGKRVDAGKIMPGEWLADFKEADVTYYYDEDDLGPFYTMMNNYEKLK